MASKLPDAPPDKDGAAEQAGVTFASEFKNYAELRQAHEQFSKAYATARSGARSTGDGNSTIQSFVEKAVDAGARISREDERRAAQTILDYWSAELITSSSVSSKDWSPAVLKPSAQDADSFHDPEADDISPEVAGQRRRARQLIRLSAVVRRWRDAGESSDYLLSGDALDEAEELMDLDPGIKALVLKSRSAERRKTKHRWMWFSSAIAVLSVLCVGLWILWQVAESERFKAEELRQVAVSERARAEEQRQAAVSERARAEEQRQAAVSERARAEEQRQVAENERARAEEQRRIAESEKIEADRQRELAEEKTIQTSKAFKLSQDRVRELEVAQTQLDVAIRLIVEALESGAIPEDAIPDQLAASVDAVRSSRYEFPASAALYLTGYNSDFLGFPVRRPDLSPELEANAFLGGGSLHYVNYSLVFDGEARHALYTASNLDRSQLLVLPRIAGKILRDPRIPDALQPELPNGENQENPLLVRAEIAWGPFFEGNEYQASENLAGVTKVFPNVIPRQSGIDLQTWSDLDRWILTEHNNSVNKVNIFAGPVNTATDPIVEGVRIPRQFWKVAVSREPVARISEQSNFLRVDAFLIKGGSGEDSGTGVDRGANGLFDAQAYRVSIAELEALTGLSFDEKIRRADSYAFDPVQSQKSSAEVLAESVDLLNSEQDTTRTNITQQIVSAVGPKGLDDEGQEKIVAALLDEIEGFEIAGLTTTGLYNYVYVLSQVPFYSWNQESWKPLKTKALKAARNLETLARRGEIHMAPKTRENLNNLKGNLGAETTGLETVYFQFDGVSRDRAVDISFALQELGWDIPGEERTHSASGVNEIRFGPETDREIAEILAEDVKTVWPNPACCKIVQVEGIKPGFLEVWISE